MGKKIATLVIVFIFGLIGVIIGDFLVNDLFTTAFPTTTIWHSIIPGVALAGISIKLAPFIINGITSAIVYFVGLLQSMPIQDLIGGIIGLIIGLIIATFIGIYLSQVPFVGYLLSVLLAVFLAYIGMSVGAKKKEDIFNIRGLFKPAEQPAGSESGTIRQAAPATTDRKGGSRPKVLDTSVIIDGRIADIVKTGFIEGPLVVPGCVLEELRHIADSSEVLKRNKGRRGLDILNMMSSGKDIEVQIYESDVPDVQEVDSKLVKIAQAMNGFVVTNDYNLNKVAQLQGVPVLNVNDLANAVKPVVIPGDHMRVEMVKEGKSGKQGIGYLEDGTMIVVEEGRDYLGQTLDVEVTSALQTSAGRMIFAKMAE